MNVTLAGVLEEIRGQFICDQSNLLALDSGKTERLSKFLCGIAG